ncbi:ABC transporter ATP-binding protein [Oceanobacillus alkalisoli]|uniref:ABC transporter ATP-binding protein n=1 Tax=Oceanobacillus alkalisoli TaxID=2925113 RepID=UPI001EF0AC62|nr:ABC transporter ATP-binding protein [Oceanobacillus alkalisoli]MCF3942236.1 ABC transporter ATP-binding protein [Oceanobacillus alkalisoli]MCG5104472.1 ABC transporter ATP-binding protein [Oceanobacillus alkalisoli]
MEEAILELTELSTHFFTDSGEIPAVDKVSFTVHKGEVVGVVGESGSGKSVTSLSILQLIPQPPGKIVSGSIRYKSENLAAANEKRMKKIRGNEISMIFQEPMTSLNPVFTIGNQMREAIRLHQKVSKRTATEKAVQMLKIVGIPRAENIVNEYPHQLSGGMRQRVMIAMAMSSDPSLLIADEPTTALDVTIQAQILDLMKKINEEKETSILLITHDLGVVADICDRVVVMYSGQVVEQGTTREILKVPKHPYTQGLIRSLPKLHGREEKLYSIPGTVARPRKDHVGCRFAPRCEFAFERCFKENPKLYNIGEGRESRCFLHSEQEGERLKDVTTNT